ncbi:hypothetical protein [Microbacterium enclense]|uniref:hypothetical protein n=1 Tax=Microbacterium enclense TaxID=993073 RepID=UPI003F7EFE20
MTFDALSFVLGVLALPALALISLVTLRVVSLFTLRTISRNGCLVCDRRGSWEIGSRSNAAFYLSDWRHSLLWANRHWHRAAWAAHRWNRAWTPGSEEHRVECTEPACEFLGVRGPYSDLRVAVGVGRQHEIAVHGRAETTTVKSRSTGESGVRSQRVLGERAEAFFERLARETGDIR